MDENAVAKTQISLRLPSDLIASYDRIANFIERDRSWVLLRALTMYLQGEGGALLEDAKALAEAERGEVVDFDEAVDGFHRLVDELEARKATRQA